MSDPFQKDIKKTTNCGDYSAEACRELPLAEVYEPNYSTQAGTAYVTELGEEKRLPAHLDLRAPIRFFSNTASGVVQSRTVSLGQLIRQAKNLETARKELLNLIQSRAQDADVQNRSLDIRDDNILEILAQVASSSKDARKVGAEALAYFIREGTEDKNLQVGLLRTIDEIRTPEALKVLKEVYKNVPELRAEIEKLPLNGSYLKNQAAAFSQAPKIESSPSVSIPSVDGKVAFPSDVITSGFKSENASPTNIIPILIKNLEAQVNRTPALKPLFDETTYNQISERLLGAAQRVAGKIETLVPYLRLAILGDAWKNPLFSLQQFSELSRTTTRWVENSLSAFLSSQEVVTDSSQPRLKGESGVIEEKNSKRNTPAQLVNFSINQNFSQPVSKKIYSANQFHPTEESHLNLLSPSLAGSQGAATQGFFGVPTLKSHGSDFHSNDYYVEPVTPLDEEGQQGFSQNSGQGSGEENSHQNSEAEQENYLA